jgi:hypothetical protein
MQDATNVEALWIQQLYKDYEDICWYFKVKLRRPMIVIDDAKTRWACWDPLMRSISVSRRLIDGHSWDVVLEILKHEMAHQYVCDVLNRPEDVGHGEAFGRACNRLGVSSWARRATGDLNDKIPTLLERCEESTSESGRLLSKTEKLLALAQSANEHEALTAMQKVRELYARYNLESSLHDRPSTFDSLVICRNRKKIEPHESRIFSILNGHFFVKVIYTSLYSAKDLTKYKAVELLGSRENLLMAEYVHSFLFKQCESLWISHRRRTQCAGNLRRSFMLGVLKGFEDKLTRLDPVTQVSVDLGLKSQQTNALVKKAGNDLDEFVETKFPRLRTKTHQKSRVDASIFQMGINAGKQINLHKGVEGRSSSGISGFLR